MPKPSIDAAQPAPRRGKGRPARNQPGVGRDAVLQATGKLMKTLSPDRITRAELAREAGIDPALVRYYFGNMASLLTEAMINVFNELNERRAQTAPDAPLREQLRRRIGTLIELLESNPHLQHLLTQPVLAVEADKASEVEGLRRDYTLASFESFRALLARAEAKGESVATDDHMLYVLVLGAAEFAAKCYRYFEMLSATRESRPATLAHYADVVANLLVDGLRPRD